jgi:hypothetical protein
MRLEYSAGDGEYLLHQPPATETFPHHGITHPSLLGPFGNTKSLALKSDQKVGTSIAHLFLVSGPAAVARFIVAIVVRKAINGVLWGWPRPHVGKEVLKGLQPVAANPDAATTIVWVQSIKAASLHLPPNLVFRHMVVTSASLRDSALYPSAF